jgi:hypothetical protein
MPITNRPSVRDIATSLLTKPKLDSVDVDQLLNRALEDAKLTTSERTQIRTVLDKFAQSADSADAVKRLKTYLDVRGDDLRNVLFSGDKDGVVDAADAKKIADVVNRDGKVNGNEKFSLGAMMVGTKMTDEARDILRAVLDGQAIPQPAGALTDIGLQPLDGKRYGLSADGQVTSGPKITFDAVGALEMYRAAEALVATRGTPPFKGVPTDVKVKTLAFLTEAFKAGKETSPLPEVTQQRIRSAAASTLLELIEGATPADGNLKKQALDLYLAQAMAEPLHGIRASMHFNLVRVAPTMDADQKKIATELQNATIPAKPPYEKWFANGKREITVKHYAHSDCWTYGTDPVTAYKNQGYTLIESKPNARPPSWILEKTNQNAPGGPVKTRIELAQTHDGIFQTMDDDRIDIITYTGHSNLGGNVSEELRLGTEEKSSKLILLAMCRGKQNMHEVANKYPNSHFITTDQPSYFSSVMPMAMGMIEGALRGEDYATMKQKSPYISDVGGKDNYFYPNESRRYAHYDIDKDGLVDGQGAQRDRLYNITLKPPTVRRTDGVVRPNELNARELDGTNVDHAVAFLNTLTTYHVDHGNHSSKFNAQDMDNFRSAGWFDGPATEKVRIKKDPATGEVHVSVNKGLHDQSWAVLGTIVQYEVAKQILAERNGGTLTKQDEARAMLFSGEYLSYMYCSMDEAERGIAAISRDSKFFRGATFDELYRSVEADGHGYVTDAQMNALLAMHP